MPEMWTEDELDVAMSTFGFHDKTDEAVLADAKARLIATAALPAIGARPRRVRRYLAAAAAVAVLVAGALVTQAVWTGKHSPTPVATAAEILNGAADLAAASKDDPVGPGQFRYLAAHQWNFTRFGPPRFGIDPAPECQRQLHEAWLPADPAQQGLERLPPFPQGPDGHCDEHGIERTFTGPFQLGSTDSVGMVTATPAVDKCRENYELWPGGPQWLAALPKEPDQVLAWLHDLRGKGCTDDLHAFLDLERALTNPGWLPARTRALLYRTMALVPGLEVTDKVANLDGRTGVALGLDDGRVRLDVIVDPANGDYIGKRDVMTKDDHGVKAGTVTTSTSVITAVVNEIGVPPKN